MAILLSDPFIPKGGGWRQTRGFAAHKRGWGGIDYAIANNSLILAVFPGTITLQRYEKGGFGYRIDLRSSDDPRYTAIYAHNAAKTVVKTGTKVIRGQFIKYSDNSGSSTGPHLHFTVLFNGKAVDPAKLPWKIYNYKVPQKPKEVDMFKDKSGIFKVTLNAAQWNASAVRYYKEYKNTLSKLDKVQAQITKLQKDFDKERKTFSDDSNKIILQLQEEYTKCRDRGVALSSEVEGLKEEIKMMKEPKGPNIPRVVKGDGFWTRVWKRLLQSVNK